MIFLFRRRIICIIILFVIFWQILCPRETIFASNSLNLYSTAYAVLDGYNDRILFDKDGNKELANASTTKILTCIIILESCDIKDYACVSKQSANQPKVRLGMKVGDEIQIIDLLYCMMLESYNDCAYLLAEYMSGSVEAFSNVMNEKAKKIGCLNSCFLTPNGLDSTNNMNYHHSSAIDLCKIMKYCAWESDKSSKFLEIVQTLSHSFSTKEGCSYNVTNRNTLLKEDSNVIAGKTGYTSKAGYCYVCAYEKDGIKYCFALLGCGWPNNKTYKWIDSRKIIEYIKSEYYLFKPKFDKSIKFPETKKYHYANINSNSINKSIKPDCYVKVGEVSFLISKNEDICKKIFLYDLKKEKYKKNDKVGTISYYINDNKCYSFDILVEKNFFCWKYADFIRVFWEDFVTI